MPYLYPEPCCGGGRGVYLCVCAEAASVPARLHSGILWPSRTYQERKKRRQTWKKDNSWTQKERVFNLTCVSVCLCGCTDKPPGPPPHHCASVLTLRKPPRSQTGNNNSHFVVIVDLQRVCTHISVFVASVCVCVCVIYLWQWISDSVLAGGGAGRREELAYRRELLDFGSAVWLLWVLLSI